MTTVRIVLSTIDSAEAARSIALQLVQERLVACVSIIADVTSVYKWKGALEQSLEHLMIMKAPADLVPELIGRIKQLHPYEVPEVVVLDVEGGHQPYLDWVCAETR